MDTLKAELDAEQAVREARQSKRPDAEIAALLDAAAKAHEEHIVADQAAKAKAVTDWQASPVLTPREQAIRDRITGDPVLSTFAARGSDGDILRAIGTVIGTEPRDWTLNDKSIVAEFGPVRGAEILAALQTIVTDGKPELASLAGMILKAGVNIGHPDGPKALESLGLFTADELAVLGELRLEHITPSMGDISYVLRGAR